MNYSILVGLIFLSTAVCTNAMQDSSPGDNSSRHIRFKIAKRTPSDKAKKAEHLPKSNNPCIQRSQAQNPLNNKNNKHS